MKRVPSFRLKKQTSKNAADATFKLMRKSEKLFFLEKKVEYQHRMTIQYQILSTQCSTKNHMSFSFVS